MFNSIRSTSRTKVSMIY